MQNDNNKGNESHSESIKVKGELNVKWRNSVMELALLISGKNCIKSVDEFSEEIDLDTAEILCAIPTNGCCLNDSNKTLKNWFSRLFVC